MAPVRGSIAATAPFLSPSFSNAAFCAAGLSVVTTLPPCFFSPVNMPIVRSKNSRSSLPVRIWSSSDSSWVEPKACEA